MSKPMAPSVEKSLDVLKQALQESLMKAEMLMPDAHASYISRIYENVYLIYLYL